MDFLKELLITVIEKEKVSVNIDIQPNQLIKKINTACFEALLKIKQILEHEGFSDFEAIEEIILVFEGLGSNCGFRHDF